MPEASEPKEVRGITKADYQHWLHHPATEVVLQYLRDYRTDLLDKAMRAWLDGSMPIDLQQEARGRVLCLEEVATLPFEAIEKFYEEVDAPQDANATEEDDGSEAAQD